MTSRARRLRKEPTDAENKLWRALRRHQLDGFDFRRQHPIGPYTLDFYCSRFRLGIELDGGQHNFAAETARDAKRSAWLAEKGIVIIRCWNHDVLTNTSGVLEDIVRVMHERAAAMTPTPTLPLSGGGRSGAEQ